MKTIKQTNTNEKNQVKALLIAALIIAATFVMMLSNYGFKQF